MEAEIMLKIKEKITSALSRENSDNILHLEDLIDDIPANRSKVREMMILRKVLLQMKDEGLIDTPSINHDHNMGISFDERGDGKVAISIFNLQIVYMH